MGEILVACFIGAWLTLAGLLSYKRLKKDYEEIEDEEMEGAKK